MFELYKYKNVVGPTSGHTMHTSIMVNLKVKIRS